MSEQIFQGLITSADPIYILEDRGARGPHRRVYSRASGRELELAAELLHPLASGSDVDRYAFGRLGSVLLFPYRREGEAMRLLTAAELSSLPLTAAYLREHEEALRGRERGRMDHDGWYAFGRTQSLGTHDRPKLGVPRLCANLRAAGDAQGVVYFDNVDVNGILVRDEGPTVWTLLVLLNSRPLDWRFRRGSVPFRGDFFSANKQFIAPLPVRRPSGQEAHRFEALGRRLHDLSEPSVGDSSTGSTPRWGRRCALASHEDLEPAQLLALLRRSRARFVRDPDTRAFRDRLVEEHARSRDRLLEHRSSLVAAESETEEAVADLYELPTAERALVDRDYE